MNQSVRFYWQHDLDLVALAVHPNFDFSGWFKRAIIAWTRGEELTIPLPLEPQPFVAKMENMKICFYLSPENDADVIKALQGIRKGYRNSAMKLIFRTYLERPYLEPYYNEQTFVAKVRGGNSSEKSVSKSMIVPKAKACLNDTAIQNPTEDLSSSDIAEANTVRDAALDNFTNDDNQVKLQDTLLQSSQAGEKYDAKSSQQDQQETTQNMQYTPEQVQQFMQYIMSNSASLNTLQQNSAVPQNTQAQNIHSQMHDLHDSSDVLTSYIQPVSYETTTKSVVNTTDEKDEKSTSETSNVLAEDYDAESYDISNQERDPIYDLFDNM